MPKRTILIVEDDANQCNIMKHWLEEAQYTVIAYPNGRTLIRNIHELQSANLLILDWNLPDISGDDLLAWIIRHNILKPIIFHTVHDFEGDVVAMLNAGADDYLIKPTQKNILLARVQAVLRRAQAIDNRSRGNYN